VLTDATSRRVREAGWTWRGRYGRMAALGEWPGGGVQASGELGAAPGLAGKSGRGLAPRRPAVQLRAPM